MNVHLLTCCFTAGMVLSQASFTVADDPVADLSEKISELAADLGEPGTNAIDGARQVQLRAAVESLFDHRIEQQRLRLKAMEQRLKTMQAKLESQVQDRTQLIDERVRAILENPSIAIPAAKEPSAVNGVEKATAQRTEVNDFLFVYIQGVLPFNPPDQPVTPPPVNQVGSGQLVSGYPIKVQEDGTISLPLLAPIKVVGKTVPEVTEAIRQRYIDEGILRPHQVRPILTLVKADR